MTCQPLWPIPTFKTDFHASVPRLLWQSCQTHTHTHTDLCTRFVAHSDILLIALVSPSVLQMSVVWTDRKKCCFFINFNILPESNICDITTLTQIGAFPQCVQCQHMHTHTHLLRCVSTVARWMSGTHTHTSSDVEENSKSDLTDRPALLEEELLVGIISLGKFSYLSIVFISYCCSHSCVWFMLCLKNTPAIDHPKIKILSSFTHHHAMTSFRLHFLHASCSSEEHEPRFLEKLSHLCRSTVQVVLGESRPKCNCCEYF